MGLGFEFQTNINVYRPHPTLLNIVDTSYNKERRFYNTAFIKELEGYCVTGKQNNHLLAHPKGTVLHHSNDGWDLTADATDCEFVTSPIHVDSSQDGADATFPGEERLIIQFASMIKFCGNLASFIRARKTRWIYSDELSIYGFPKSILYVQEAPGIIAAFPQITGGLRLTRLRKLFRHLAKNSNTEAAKLFLGEGVSSNYSATLGNVSKSLKPSDIKACVKDAGWDGHDPSAQLRGLLTLIAFYLRKGSGEYPAKVAKQFFFIMSRTDFAQLFKELPNAEQKHYRDNPAEWVDLCCKRISGKITPPGLDINGKVIEQKINDYGALQAPVQIPITRKAWLTGIAQGQDLLCAAAHPHGQDDATYFDVNGNSRLRGLGGLGDAVDVIITKDLTGRAPVFEFRGPTFSGARFAYTEWTAYARKCYRFLYAINVHQKQEQISEADILSLKD